MNNLPIILQRVRDAGGAVFEQGDLNLNIVGMRAPNSRAGEFDDRLVVAWRASRVWHLRSYAITTDPGKHYLQEPLSRKGTAILCEGQYRGAYVVGKHKGYHALVQDRPVAVWRDNTGDNRLDHLTPEVGVFGINIHCADANPLDGNDALRTKIGRWSAGCQVFQHAHEYRDFMAIVDMAVVHWGPRFTYTLIEGP